MTTDISEFCWIRWRYVNVISWAAHVARFRRKM